jgi:hypothetical protein
VMTFPRFSGHVDVAPVSWSQLSIRVRPWRLGSAWPVTGPRCRIRVAPSALSSTTRARS